MKSKRRCVEIAVGIIVWSLFFSSAYSLLISRAPSISSFGQIQYISPLHVDGKYIKDHLDRIVYLRGINKVEFADQPGGTWMGQPVMDYSDWSPSNVRNELTKMREWEINTIRCHQAVEHWKFNLGQHRQIIKEFIRIAADYDMYVIYDGYSLTNYWHGAEQDPLPYPPYQTSQNSTQIIASEDEFVDWWVSIATELKDYPNVIFELWNEPYGNNNAMQSWFDVAQRCIDAIRSTGATQLIIFQWEMACWVNLDFPPPNNSASTMDWVWQANLTDPLGNLVYSTHMYRCFGHFHHSIPSYWNAWNYSEIQLAFQYYMFPEVTADYPLFIGEIGADMVYTGEELEHELKAFDNCLKLFEEMEIHYTVFWWRDFGMFPLHDGPIGFIPNEAGQIVEKYLLGP